MYNYSIDKSRQAYRTEALSKGEFPKEELGATDF